MKNTNILDLYTEVTDRIIAELEKGIIPWNKPWCGVRSGAISYATGKPSSMVNQFLLKPGEYITFNQCRARGGKVKKGAKSHMVVFWKVIYTDKKDRDGNPVLGDDGKPIQKPLPMLKYFNVFNIEDCEGIKPRWQDKLPSPDAQPVEAAEAVLTDYIRRSGVGFENVKQDRAYYSITNDKISIPLKEQFPQIAEYYSTAFHEATHSTGHSSRLNRFTGEAACAMFGSESYSKEELVAEIGAACILNDLGIETPATFKNSAAYIQNWLHALKNDKRLIVSAASRADKAVRLILNLGKADTSPDAEPATEAAMAA